MCRCLPDRTLPSALKDSYQKGQWTDYMGRVMAYIGGCGPLHEVYVSGHDDLRADELIGSNRRASYL